ncbi:MAG TPA: hypothetical protein EYH14_02030 [Euryarchaeota archaeon]|nr:hypothetical protein [Euryarchaeota archaeon]
MSRGALVKRNKRNIVIITPFVVLKYRKDWNLRKIFWEFLLTWRAFLHGVSEIPVLCGPVMVRKTATGVLLAKADLKRVWPDVLRTVAVLSRAGIEHKELRHPQHHVVIGGDGKKINILDFERGKLTAKPRNLSRFVVWLLERGVEGEDIEKVLNSLKNVPIHDVEGARKAIKKRKEGRS